MTALEPGWSSRHHGDEFIRSLERYAFPLIGHLDVAAIDKHAVLRVLEQKLPQPDQGRRRRYALASAHGDGRSACGAGSSG